jgi:hypothetical protein
MTVWEARLAKQTDLDPGAIGRQILCGRVVDGQYACGKMVAWLTRSGDVALPNGLTDEARPSKAPEPGVYRWSEDAKRAARDGKSISRDLRTSRQIRSDVARAARAGVRKPAGEPLYLTPGMLRTVAIGSIRTLPCPHRPPHDNRLAADLSSR